MNSELLAPTSTAPCRILSLDGGGAKGFYTLGVLREIEGMIGCLCMSVLTGVRNEHGCNIAALIALGHRVDESTRSIRTTCHELCREKSREKNHRRSLSCKGSLRGQKFDSVKTGVGIVTTKWVIERPMIFKGSIAQAHGRTGTFSPGFGCRDWRRGQASCPHIRSSSARSSERKEGDIWNSLTVDIARTIRRSTRLLTPSWR